MPSVGASGQRKTFFPKAEATVLQSKYSPPPIEARPTIVAPILDVAHHDKPLQSWPADVANAVYPSKYDIWGPAPIPDTSSCPHQCLADRYLFPVLAHDERLRLTMLWYYTRGALQDQELMSRLQEKVHLAKETIGWEFVICGLLSHNTYTRMVTVGLPLALLPRRESTCSHTINQPGAVFSLLNMAEDWRFKHSPHVELGGLRSYAGVPLRFETEFEEHVAFGSLCVASNTPQEPLSKEQQTSLVRLADWIVADLIHSARARRQRDRLRMQEYLSMAQKQCDKGMNMEELIPEMLREAYPSSIVGIHRTTNGTIDFGVEGGGTVFRTLDLQYGLWEDVDYFDYMIEELNHQDMVAPRIVRVVSTQCASQRMPTFLVMGSKDFKVVFDDVDAWFIQMCATLLCRYWQSRALKEAKAAKKTFLRGITHQLRTPIHGILGSAELLTEELKARNLTPATSTSSPSATPNMENPDPYMYINTIKTSARELIGTVNSLIKLNQWADIVQAKRSIGLHTITELETSILNEMALALSEDLSIRPFIIISHCLPSGCDTFAIDLRLFVDTILPVVLNAAQNTAVNGVVAVTLSLTDDYQSFIVDVEDNGNGIAPDHVDRIFIAYEKTNLPTTDAGLGLTLACKSATLLNGKITLVSSTPGQGSHFRATFHEPVCASSFPRHYSVKDRLGRLPISFYRTPSPETSLLGRYICRYLTQNGYIESSSRENAFSLIEYTSNLAQLYSHVSDVGPGQVAICLVPESAYFIDFGGDRLTRQGRVVYVQAPFSSSILNMALELADTILAETESANLDLRNGSHCTFTVDASVSQSLLSSKDPAGVPLHRGSTCPEAVQTDLAQAIEILRLETPPVVLLTAPCSRSRKPITLLVDDNAVNLRLLEMYCNRRGLPYQTAKDGQEAVRIFSQAYPCSMAENNACKTPGQRAPFELILMDLQMPICDGIDATRQIRNIEKKLQCKKSVLFIVTGQDSPSDRTHAEEAGSDGYLVKPVGPKVLDKWVKQWFPDAEL